MNFPIITAYFDGVCEPVNPGGYASYGILITKHSKDDYICLLKESKFVGNGNTISNNVAEYSGTIRILEFLIEKKLQEEHIIIHGDSKLVIMQMIGQWQIKQGIYVPFALKCLDLLKGFKNLSWKWIPREENNICDVLSKDVLKSLGVKFRIQPE